MSLKYINSEIVILVAGFINEYYKCLMILFCKQSINSSPDRRRMRRFASHFVLYK